MARSMIWTCGLAILAGAALAIGASAATTPAPAPRPQPSTTDNKPATPQKHTTLPGEYAGMVRECKMTPDQVEQAWQRIDGKKKALADFDKQKPTKLATYQKDLATAKQKSDEASTTRLQDSIKALQNGTEKEKLEMAQEVQIMGSLKPEQRQTWEGFLLYQKATIEMKADNLTPEQLPQVREIANGFAKDVIASQDIFKARKEVVSKVVKAYHKEGPMPGEKQ